MNKIEREKIQCLIASAQDLLNADATQPENTDETTLDDD